jgi:hypothetical protein
MFHVVWEKEWERSEVKQLHKLLRQNFCQCRWTLCYICVMCTLFLFIIIFIFYVTVLDVEAFERLLGPCMNIMKRNIDDYEDQIVRIFGSKTNITDIR